MKKASSGKKVSIQVAAKALGVSKGTIVQHLNNGKLSRIKEGSTVYISADEINRLLEAREDSPVITPKARIPESKHVVVTKVKSSEGDGTTVTVDRSHYEEILTRVGRL